MRVLQTQRCSESGSATRNQVKGMGGGGEDDGPLNVAARVAVVEGGCLDSVVTGPYGGSKVETEEETARRGTPSTGSATGTSTVENNRRARVRVHP
jgi:hypothetical protein